MNAGSYIGRATAFELNILANLNDVKSTDNSRTLLYFLIEILEEKQPDLLNFGDELFHLHEAANVNTDDVDEAIKEIDGMLDYIKSELENSNEALSGSDDKFVDVMTSFTLKCHAELQKLMKMQKHMQIRCIKVANVFAIDIKQYRITECFKDIATFKGLFAKQLIEIRKSRESKKMAGKSEKPSIMKESNVVRRNLKIVLNRLSIKGLYLYFCIAASLNTN